MQNNRYPKNVINFSIRQKTARANSQLREVPKVCPVYLKLSWLSKIFHEFENQVKSADSQV